MDARSVLSLDFDYCTSVLNFGSKINILIPERADWQDGILPYSGASIYTDGSKTDTSTGSGVFSFKTST